MSDQRRNVDLVLITGYSGAGRTEAMHAFEDGGYFCVDNLPPRLIEALGELFQHEGSGVERAAIVCDIRGGAYFQDAESVLDELRERGLGPTVLFLEADEQTLLDRFKETRRRHPAAPEGQIIDGIRREKELLQGLRDRADVILNTSGLTGAMLRRRIADEFIGRDAAGRLAVTVLSFGFKEGTPRDADLVFDCRFLPNPHYVDELRPLTGLDDAVVSYMQGEPLEEFYEHLLGMLDFLVPGYIAEGKSHLSVAIGCTGGRHRSVAIAEHVARHLGGRDDVVVNVVHRDAGV